MKRILAAAAAATISFAAMPASATTFDFKVDNKGSSAWTKDGLTVTVSGWSTTSNASSATPSSGTATAWLNNGYGVMNATTDGSHTVDNAGYYDFLRLEFSKAVTLDQVSLKAFNDTDAWVSFGSTSTSMTTANGWSTFIKNGSDFMGGFTDRSFSPNLTTTPATVWLIGAARGASAGSNDEFKVSAINVTAAVPEPSTWAMMLVGFGMVGAVARRRKSAAKVTFA
jgi:hypothetical protein